MSPDGPMYSLRVADALAFAAEAFQHERRKATRIPYITHLLQVATWVYEYGGDEDQFVAALLHDYLEDIEGASREILEERFGARVAQMVVELSDAIGDPHNKPPWRQRKERYLDALKTKDPDVKLVSACDKLHNAQSIIRDLDDVGPVVWTRFTGKRDGTLWYYEAVVDALGTNWDHVALDHLQKSVETLHEEAANIDGLEA